MRFLTGDAVCTWYKCARHPLTIVTSLWPLNHWKLGGAMWVTCHQYNIAHSDFFAVIRYHRKYSSNLLRFVLPRLALTPARPTSRLKWLGRVERGVKSRVDVVLGPPHPAHLVSSPILSGSPLRVSPVGRPPGPLFTNHNRAVPTVKKIYII